jgi:cytochrome c biogenesis protein CcmG, thiol:disulfide interchange protein DsbE
MFSVRGLIAVLITAVIVSIPLHYYWDFLNRGRRPSAGTLRLNQLEKEGVPDFTLPDLQGKAVSLSQFAGRPVLVNLWASWCAPCVKEFPALKRLIEHFHGKLVILAVSHDHNRDDLETFIQAFGTLPPDFVILWDKERITGPLFGTEQLPETYILDKDHKLVRKIAGEQAWDNPRALEFFSHVLGI